MQAQNTMILAWLKDGNTLTALQAVRAFGCLRLAARVCDLRALGHVIHAGTVKSGKKRFAVYSMGRRS